jgi:N-acetylglutamate synthase-like GNAT family acetyltransferase
MLWMEKFEIVDLTPENIADYGVCGYKDVGKHVELQRKIEWFRRYHPLGLRIKAVIMESGGYQGMLEYIPGKYAHRPVDADRYMFIHCIFVGFRKEYKGRGLASALLEECIRESKEQGLDGVAVVTRKGSFMADRDIFQKKGFVAVDGAPPDFELLALRFGDSAKDPCFRKDMMDGLKRYGEGVTILRSPQCPYSVKNVNAIMASAKDEFGMRTSLVEIEGSDEAQTSPCPFGVFCIVHDGELIADHPISNTRFVNIMRKRLKR